MINNKKIKQNFLLILKDTKSRDQRPGRSMQGLHCRAPKSHRRHTHATIADRRSARILSGAVQLVHCVQAKPQM